MPNFVLIGPAVWISIENTQTNKHTDIALYVLDSLFLNKIYLYQRLNLTLYN